MKRILLLALFITCSCHAVSPQKITPEEAKDLVKKNLCDLQISFGSYGSGTPSQVQGKIDTLLKSQSGVTKISTWAWGREGESDYCVEFKEEKELFAAKDKIVKIIPPFSKDGYTILKFQGKEMMRTQWPKE